MRIVGVYRIPTSYLVILRFVMLPPFIMSAGTGIYHSEYNKNQDKEVRFLQIWLFPNQKNVQPRYDQISIQNLKKRNQFYQVLSPNPDDDGVWAYQDAWFHLGDFDEGVTATYHLKREENGVYVFVLEGSVRVNDHELQQRDGLGIWDTRQLSVTTNSKTKVLLMDVPMS